MSSGQDELITKTIYVEAPAKGTKADNGKASLSLIPRAYLEGTANAFGYGANKYGKWNYTKGIEITRTLDAAMRHILAFLDREDLDPESGLNHLFHASASLAMTIYNLEHNQGLDDRLKKK